MRKLNREPIWDKAGEIPSGWGNAKAKPSVTDKSMSFFYKKLQYHGSVDQGKRLKKQPMPQSRDILRQRGIDHRQSVDVLQERVRSREEL